MKSQFAIYSYPQVTYAVNTLGSPSSSKVVMIGERDTMKVMALNLQMLSDSLFCTLQDTTSSISLCIVLRSPVLLIGRNNLRSSANNRHQPQKVHQAGHRSRRETVWNRGYCHDLFLIEYSFFYGTGGNESQYRHIVHMHSVAFSKSFFFFKYF